MGRLPKKTTLHGLPTPRSCIAYGLTHENEVEMIRKDKGDDKILDIYEGLHRPEVLDNLWQKWNTEEDYPKTVEGLFEHFLKMWDRITLVGAAYFQILFDRQVKD